MLGCLEWKELIQRKGLVKVWKELLDLVGMCLAFERG